MKLKQNYYVSNGSTIWVNIYKGFPHNEIRSITTVYEIISLFNVYVTTVLLLLDSSAL